MIHYLKIRNFEAIKDEVEISFEVVEGVEEDSYVVTMPDGVKLLKLAYIYGPNASGKTTVLNAFQYVKELLLDPLNTKNKELEFDPFLFLTDPYKEPTSFQLSFYVDGIRYLYEVLFNKHAILTEKMLIYRTSKPTELFSRNTDMERRLTKIQFAATAKIPSREKNLLESNTLHNNTVLGAFARTNVDIPVLELLNKWISDFFLQMITSTQDLISSAALELSQNSEINNWIDILLNKADAQIEGVIIQRDLNLFEIDFIHKVKNEESYTLSIEKESSGTKRYFGLGAILYKTIQSKHFLCIDELETSLHPELMKHFLQLFLLNSENSQLLITTHNLSLMEEKDFIRRDALWLTEKLPDGSVSLYSAADFDSSTLRKDASLINAYKAGRLGAKPNLGSPYIIKK